MRAAVASWLLKQSFSVRFIKGLFIGCLMSSAVYLLLTSYLTTWTSQNPASKDHSFFMKAPGAAILTMEGLNGFKLARSQSNSVITTNSRQDKHTSSRLRIRKTLLSIVPVSRQATTDSYNTLKKSWWQNSKESKMIVGGKGHAPLLAEDDNDDVRHLHYASGCADFISFSGPPDHDWSPHQLTCLLETIFIEFHNMYNWFVITSAHTYLSTAQLERVLKPMDPLAITYMGQPHPSGYCSYGAGIVLSKGALENIIPYLNSCLRGSTSRGEEFLGKCFMDKLKTQCYKLHRAKKYFINKKEVDLNIEKLKYPDSQFTTIYPVHSVDEMISIYQADLLREVRYHLSRVEKKKKELYKSSICKRRTYTPKSQPVVNQTANVTEWSSFGSLWTYVRQNKPRDWFDGELKMEMEKVAKEGLTQYNDNMKSSLKYSNLTYGMYRYLGVKGKEYILDFNTREETALRLHILRPHEPQVIPLKDSTYEALHEYVNFVVPLSNVSSRFVDFMLMYEKVCLKVHKYCKLHLVVYGKNEVQFINEGIVEYKSKYPSAVIKIIPAQGKFSRGKALNLGISTLKSTDLIFTCDVDITIKRSFINRCRQNALQGRRIYYPEVFKYYNMDYVYWYEQKPKPVYEIDHYHGHWCTYGFGMFCMYKSDYEALGGYDLTIEGWGGEDIKLANSTLWNGYDIMRSPDPALSHRYHPRTCSKDLSDLQYKWCISSRDEEIADPRRLAEYVRYLENVCNTTNQV